MRFFFDSLNVDRLNIDVIKIYPVGTYILLLQILTRYFSSFEFLSY